MQHFSIPLAATRRRTLGVLTVALAMWLAGPAESPAQSLAIDDFSTNQASVLLTFPPAGTMASSSVSGAGILGGERDIQINLTGGVIGGNSMSAVVNSGFFSYSQDATIAGSGTLQWDGTDNSPTLNPTGLGGADLTVSGTQDAFLLRIAFDDLPVGLTLEVFTDAGNASMWTFTAPGLIFTNTDYVLPYNAFTTTLGAGANFANVGAIRLTLGSGVTAPDVVLDFLQTTALVTATKTVAIQNDVDGDGNADPGDTIRYTSMICNPDDAFDAAATGVVFTSPVPANTTLVTGGVTTTQGTVTSGNGGGDTSVAVNVGNVADATCVTITFDVIIDNPLPAGVTQIVCQGLVTTTGIPGIPTDGVPGSPPDDPTTIPVQGSPAITATKADTLLIDGNGNGMVDPGETVKYTVILTNTGNQNASGVVFTSGIDPNTNLVVGSVTTTGGTITTGNTAGDTTVAVNIGTLVGAGGSVTIMFSVTIDNPLPAGVTQVACQGIVTGTNIPTTPTDDPDTPAPGDPTTTPISGMATITATKADILLIDGNGNGAADAGETVQYTVILTNTGNVAASGVVFTSGTDANTGLVVGSVTTTQGTITLGNTAGNTTVAVNVGTIAGAGGTVTITFNVTIDNPLPPGTTMVACQGTVTGTNIPSIPTDDPDTPAPGDPTVTPINPPPVNAPPIPPGIPTLGEWGLVLLALLLLGFGTARLRRWNT